jgi:hypothetical protein
LPARLHKTRQRSLGTRTRFAPETTSPEPRHRNTSRPRRRGQYGIGWASRTRGSALPRGQRPQGAQRSGRPCRPGSFGQGLNAGGSAYGYVPVLGDKGKRVIVEAEAEIVRRIFDEYVAGRTPREIAHDLNHEGVLPPRGRSWNASTINGNMQRGTGIIQNELYTGRLVWNKVRMVKDPDTGKRLSRPNPKNDWQTADVRRGSAALSLSTHNLPLAIRRAFGQTWAVGPLRAKSSRSAISGLTGRVTDAVFCRKPGCMRMEGALARPGGKSDSSSLNQPVR